MLLTFMLLYIVIVYVIVIHVIDIHVIVYCINMQVDNEIYSLNPRDC